MLLVIDVGNTNITLGVFNGENLSATFRMTTKIQRTSDEYGIALNELIWHQGFEKEQTTAVQSAGADGMAPADERAFHHIAWHGFDRDYRCGECGTAAVYQPQ